MGLTDAFDVPVETDARLPPCTVLIRSHGEQVLLDTSGAGLMQTPEFTEDLASLRESLPYVIRFREGTEPIRCECCGTTVFAVPESEWVTPRRWRQAVWEPGTGRKHTMRRCDRMRTSQ